METQPGLPSCLPCAWESSHTCPPWPHHCKGCTRPGGAVGGDPAQPSALSNTRGWLRGREERPLLAQHQGQSLVCGEEEGGTSSLRLHSHGRDLLPSLLGWDLALQVHCSGSEHLPEGNKPDRYFAQIIELYLDAQHIHLQDS